MNEGYIVLAAAMALGVLGAGLAAIRDAIRKRHVEPEPRVEPEPHDDPS